MGESERMMKQNMENMEHVGERERERERERELNMKPFVTQELERIKERDSDSFTTFWPACMHWVNTAAERSTIGIEKVKEKERKKNKVQAFFIARFLLFFIPGSCFHFAGHPK